MLSDRKMNKNCLFKIIYNTLFENQHSKAIIIFRNISFNELERGKNNIELFYNFIMYFIINQYLRLHFSMCISSKNYLH